MRRCEGQHSFRLGRFDGHEEIAIPARKIRGQALGLAACLVTWPLAAFAKYGLAALFSGGGWHAMVFLLGVVLIVLFVFALLQIVWWLGGSERIAVIGQDLLVRHTLLGLPVATRSYRGADMRFLAPVAFMPAEGWLKEPSVPFLSSSNRGALKVFYRGETVYLGHDLERADAGAVVAWLAARLPAGAVEVQV